MNRPKVISEINSHHARKCVGPFRLRAVECDRLSQYIEHLEANQRPAVVRSLASLEPEERVLAGLRIGATDDVGAAALRLVVSPNLCAVEGCTLDGGHDGPCAQPMTA